MIRDIAEAVDLGASSYEEVREIIDNVPYGDRNDLSLIGTILTPDDDRNGVHLSHFSYGVDTFTEGDIEIEAAGTGADDLLELVPQTLKAVSAPNCDRNDNQFSIWVLQQGLALVSQFIGNESATGQNLLDWWGGAFEFAMLDRGRFRKISNILHTSWRATRVGMRREFQLTLTSKFMKYDYFGDALVVQTLELSNAAAGGQSRVKEHCYWVYTPLLKGTTAYDFTTFMTNAPTFAHETISCFVFLDPEITDIGHLTYIHGDPKGDRSVEIERLDDPDRFQIRVQPVLLRELETAIAGATGFVAIHE